MKQWLVRIGLALLALCLAAYLIVPNWILAKPREALIEAVRQELAADWKSKAVAFAGEGSYGGETVLWFTIEMPEKTQYKAAVCRVLENGRYRLTKIENPSTYCLDIVSYGILGQQPGLPHNHHKRQHFRRGDQNRPHAGGATVCIYC